MKFTRKPATEATFDLTPLIDVVLLLIIFFMLSSQFQQSMAKPMDLPREAGERSPATARSAIIVSIERDGAMTLVDGRAVSGDELVRLAKEAETQRRTGGTGGAASEAVELVIRAHRDAPALYVNKLAGLLARNGIRTWKLATAGDV